MFLHHFVCSVHFPTVQKHTGFETIPHLYWKNDKGVKPANGFQPAFSGHSVIWPPSHWLVATVVWLFHQYFGHKIYILLAQTRGAPLNLWCFPVFRLLC